MKEKKKPKKQNEETRVPAENIEPPIKKIMPLNQKGINSIIHIGYLSVWEGAVRSGKTVCACIAMILKAYMSNDNYFIMSGKTIATLYKNCIGGDYGILNLFKGMITYKRDSEGNRVLLLKGRDGNLKTIYCFGANDERSYQSLRGLTVAGWYGDEINLHPRSFVEEALRRTIVSKDRFHIWTLNPDSPYHWIYTEYIDKYQNIELPGFKLWFFDLNDNPSLSEERKEQLKSQYSGLFYRRYILGERCIAEGAIYDMFDDKNKYDDEEIGSKLSTKFFNRYIAVDYGTTNPCVFLEIYDDGKNSYVNREYYWDSKVEMRQKTDEEYANDLEKFIEEGQENSYYKYAEVIIDPSAESLSVALKKRGIYVTDAENEVENGIRRVSTLFGNKTLKINSKCKRSIGEITSYAWNDKKAVEQGKEEPIKQHDHACDALRYFVNTRVAKWRVGEE